MVRNKKSDRLYLVVKRIVIIKEEIIQQHYFRIS